jgi:putative transposase
MHATIPWNSCTRFCVKSVRKPPSPHYRHRFPAELISHAVWLYHIFSLSFRDVELLLAERGWIVSYESVRQWCLKFGASFADKMRRRRPKPGDKWHLDEVFIRIGGVLHFLWRAVDQDGVVLDILVQSRRDAGAAKRALLPDVEHRKSRYLNNRAENSHRPTRRRERQMQRFKSPPQAQGFLSAHAFIYGHFRPRRHRMTAASYRSSRATAFWVWREETCAQMAAC